jgi:hypothetical protein
VDDRLRSVYRAWLAGETSSETYARARERAGLDHRILESAAISEKIVQLWPKLKSGRLKAMEKITYDEASEIVESYFIDLGWKRKLYRRADQEVPEGYFSPNEYVLYPLGFPEERDPDWAPVSFGSLISPDFNFYFVIFPRICMLRQAVSRTDSLSGNTHWSWEGAPLFDIGELGPWNLKTIAYHLLFRARNGLEG